VYCNKQFFINFYITILMYKIGYNLKYMCIKSRINKNSYTFRMKSSGYCTMDCTLKLSMSIKYVTIVIGVSI